MVAAVRDDPARRLGLVYRAASSTDAFPQAQCLKDWRLRWISGGGWVCG